MYVVAAGIRYAKPPLQVITVFGPSLSPRARGSDRQAFALGFHQKSFNDITTQISSRSQFRQPGSHRSVRLHCLQNDRLCLEFNIVSATGFNNLLFIRDTGVRWASLALACGCGVGVCRLSKLWLIWRLLRAPRIKCAYCTASPMLHHYEPSSRLVLLRAHVRALGRLGTLHAHVSVSRASTLTNRIRCSEDFAGGLQIHVAGSWMLGLLPGADRPTRPSNSLDLLASRSSTHPYDRPALFSDVWPGCRAAMCNAIRDGCRRCLPSRPPFRERAFHWNPSGPARLVRPDRTGSRQS